MYSMIIVDDEKIICDGLNKFISKSCTQFFVAESFYNANTALEYVKTNPVDLILTDIKMPDMTGLELADKVREFNDNVQIIILTGFRNFDYAQKAIQKNVFSYLLKPIDNVELLSVLSCVAQRISKIKEIQNVKKQNEELIEGVRERFFVKILFGVYDTNSLKDSFKKLYFDADSDNILFNILIFNWSKDLPKSTWKYGTDGAKMAVKNYFYTENKKIVYLLWLDQDQLLLMHNDNDINSSFEGLSDWFSDSFGIHLSFKNSYNCIGIQSLAKNSFHEETTHLVSQIDNARISLLNTYIRLSLYDEAQLMFDAILQDCLSMDKSEGMSQIKKIFDIIAIDQNIVMDELQQSHDFFATYQHYFERILGSQKSKRQKEYDVIKRIKEYVAQNYASDITLEEIGSKIFMNPVYLSRYFKQQTGENFSSYLLSIRMVNAIRLLKDRNYKIHEIANKVGYQNPRNFAKQFKLFTGFTPKQYRANI